MTKDRHQVFWAASIAFVLTAFFGLQNFGALLHGALLNPDSAMRLVRLDAMLQAHAPLHAVARDGHGTVLHWSHLLDSVLLLMAWPFASFLGWHQGLVVIAPMVGPLSMAALGASLAWAGAPVTAPQWRPLGALLACLSPAILNYGLPGVVHHHVLIAAVAVMSAGHALRIVRGLGRASVHGAALGAWSGLGVWLTPESTPICLMVIGLVWMCWLERPTATMARALAAIGGAMFIVTGAAWLADPPAAGVLAAEQDRLSLVFVCLAAGLMMAGIAAARGLSRIASVVLAGVLAAAWIAAFPMVLGGTAGLLPADTSQVFLGDILEMRPVSSLSQAVATLAAAAVATIWLAVQSLRHRSWPGLYAVACSVALMIAAALHIRFGTYPALFAAAVFPVAASTLAAAGPRLLVLLAALLLPRAGDLAAAASSAPPSAYRTCDLRGTASLLAPFAGRIVLAHVNDTPDLLWQTGIRTVGSLYHRSPDGFLRLRAAWQSEAGTVVPPAVRATGAGFVLVCPGAALPAFIAAAQTNSLAQTLGNGEVPPWLHRVGIADPGGMVLYAVDEVSK